MAQVDPTTSVEEAMAVGVGVGDDNDSETMKMNEVEYAYAPESFWVSKDAELDWVDRNAYLERKDSGKATSSGNSNSNSNSNTSQRYSGNLKSNTSLLALPKPHKQLKIRRNTNTNTNGDGVSGRLFSKPVLSMNEPGSPKVSCMGRVKSRKDSRRKNKPQSQIIQTQTQSQSQPALVRNKSRSGVSVKQRRSGFWSNFRSMFHYKGKGKGKEPHTHSKMNDTKEEYKQSSSSFSSESTITNSKNNNKRAFQCDSSKSKSNDVISMEQQPPSLGGMKRFASGRKSDSWAGDVHVHIDAGPIWLRREVDADPPQLLFDVHRDCRAVSVPVGPLSV